MKKTPIMFVIILVAVLLSRAVLAMEPEYDEEM